MSDDPGPVRSGSTPDPEGGADLGLTIRFGPGPSVVIEGERLVGMPEDGPGGGMPGVRVRPRLRLLHGGLDGVPVADVPAQSVDEPPGR